MASENDHDFDRTIATFAHPRYELMASGQVFDGEDEVRRYFVTSRSAFPDQHNENAVLHQLDAGVLAEFDLVGTHLGPLAGAEPTGRPFRARMAALFLFEDGGVGITCERVYYDAGTILRQLGLGS
ncbi:MAG: ester cyclase [Acidimicrobiia bacterium]|nr:ester cyclase [Acidimicrobiia bacterium]